MEYAKRMMGKRWVCFFIAAWIALGFCLRVNAEESKVNRWNIVIVTDASGSMKATDPSGLRFEAIKQFISLLAQKGNSLGGVVFSDTVVAREELARVDDWDSKLKTMNTIQGVAPSGDTNIGEGLITAMEMLQADGDSSLPSAILFLSDGNTDLKTPEALNKSLEQKAEAIQLAREQDVQIYSICLNANQTADVSEMQQISEATGGSFKEVNNADDLQDVFNAFYNMIYGVTSRMEEQLFPENGIIEKRFHVPPFGVEEVNIVVSGKTESMSLLKPDNTPYEAEPIISDTFSVMKIVQAESGEWVLITKGVPGDKIRINMVYNSNLDVKIQSKAIDDVTNPKDPVTVIAEIVADGVNADENGIRDYHADLIVADAYGNELERVPMDISGNHFELHHNLAEGNYYLRARVSNDFTEKYSDSIGPVRVSSEALTEEEKNNTEPTAEKTKVTKTIYLIPFRKSVLKIDLNGMAKDAQDKDLVYTIQSSSFMENKDYTFADETITMQKFSLSKGSFEIKATDSGGLSTSFEIMVRAINVGFWTAIGILIVVLIVIVLLVLVFIKIAGTPFAGKIKVKSQKNGQQSFAEQSNGKGYKPLAWFRVDDVGLPMKGARFKASGKKYITLEFKKEVYCRGKMTKEIRIDNNISVIVKANQDAVDFLEVTFLSTLPAHVR